jgi:hypothetical protein
MLKRALVGLVLLSLLGAGFALGAGATITLKGGGPEPRLITVEWGDTVTFANADNKAHSVTIPRIGLDSPTIEPGATFEHVFNGRRGNYLWRQLGGGPNFPATIIVDLKGTVSLVASTRTVQYGKSLKLSGKSSFPGTPVNVAERVPGGGADWAKVASVTADAEGAYSLQLKPTRGARYRAQVADDQVYSEPVLIALKPVVTIRTQARKTTVGHKITITGRVTPATAAISLDLERYDTRRRRWLSQLRAKVGRRGTATFRWPARKGESKLRVAVKPLTVRAGWTATASPFVTVTGV